jgi:hypothetical protein
MLATLKPGRIAEAGESEFNSRAAEGTILFGQAVKMGTVKGKQVKAWDGAAATDIFDGIAMMTVAGDVDNDRYLDGMSVSALIKGKPSVLISAASATVAPGDRVAVYPDGHFGKAPLVAGTSGTYGVELLNAVFKTGAAAGGNATIQIVGPTDYKVVKWYTCNKSSKRAKYSSFSKRS